MITGNITNLLPHIVTSVKHEQQCKSQWTSDTSEVSSFYYGNKVFIVYLGSLLCTEALVAWVA